jgi:hypothetical protein
MNQILELYILQHMHLLVCLLEQSSNSDACPLDTHVSPDLARAGDLCDTLKKYLLLSNVLVMLDSNIDGKDLFLRIYIQ